MQHFKESLVYTHTLYGSPLIFKYMNVPEVHALPVLSAKNLKDFPMSILIG